MIITLISKCHYPTGKIGLIYRVNENTLTTNIF